MIVEGLVTAFVDDASGTPTDMSPSLTAYTGPFTNRASSDYHTMDTLDPKVTRGGKTGRVTLTVLEEPGTNTPHALLFDWHEDDDAEARTIELNVPDDEPGSTRYSAEYWPVGEVQYSMGTAGSTNPRTAQFTFNREGPLAKNVIA